MILNLHNLQWCRVEPAGNKDNTFSMYQSKILNVIELDTSCSKIGGVNSE